MQVVDVVVKQVERRNPYLVELIVNVNLSDAVLCPTNIPWGWIVAGYHDNMVVLNGIPTRVVGGNSAFTTAKLTYADFNVNEGNIIAKAFIF